MKFCTILENRTSLGQRTGETRSFTVPAFDTLHVEYHNTLNENCYAVESPDRIEPFGKGSYTIQRYGENNIGAGIFYRGQRYNTCILGYPFETIKTEKQRNELMNAILSSFDQTITHQ